MELEFVLTVGASILETFKAGRNGSQITRSDCNYILTLISNILPLGFLTFGLETPEQGALSGPLPLALFWGLFIETKPVGVDRGGVWGAQAQGRSGKGASWFWGWGHNPHVWCLETLRGLRQEIN